MKPAIGIIGGSGFYTLAEKYSSVTESVVTPYSQLPVDVSNVEIGDKKVVFIPRHGAVHAIPPHKINYRANLYAMKSCGVDRIIAVNVVGGISPNMAPGMLMVPDQLIDYTWGREHTFFDELGGAENHIDFTWPYDKSLGRLLEKHAREKGYDIQKGGVYGCTQGPRLETAAEIHRMARDGCDIVGMTGMPEAALARELDISYACIALVVNWAAGVTDRLISFEDIATALESGIAGVRDIVLASVAELD